MSPWTWLLFLPLLPLALCILLFLGWCALEAFHALVVIPIAVLAAAFCGDTRFGWWGQGVPPP